MSEEFFEELNKYMGTFSEVTRKYDISAEDTRALSSVFDIILAEKTREEATKN